LRRLRERKASGSTLINLRDGMPAHNKITRFTPAGKCIYCGNSEADLSDEHIIAYALNGHFILPDASCPACAKKTQKIEEICTHEHYGMFHPLRTKLNLASRRGRERHKHLPVLVVNKDGSKATISVESAGFPIVAWGLELPPAGILLGAKPSNTVECSLVMKGMEPATLSPEISALPKDASYRLGRFNITAFMHMLAKIGYAFAAAVLGRESLLPLVADIILEKTDVCPYLIGGGTLGRAVDTTALCLHRLELVEAVVRDQRFTLATICLFVPLGLPTYHVVVRQRPFN
jgi:hypothetical protein